MYRAFYGFSEKPFNVTPNPAFIYFSRTHQEAFAHLLYGINGHVGFMAITGEVGTGKTTVLRTLLGQLDGKNYRTALIFNPSLSSAGLMQAINREFGIPHTGLNNEELLDELNRFLLERNADGDTVVLVIDEAQNLKQEVLEQIRLISNLETERDKLIQIILAGQPELEQLLERHELRQLNQRIAVRFRLSGMDFEDTVDYVNHRLSVAGGGNGVSFATAALGRVFRFSGGVPRLINLVCDRALLAGYARGQRQITSRLAAVAVKDLRKTEKKCYLSLRLYPAGVIVFVLILITAVFGVSRMHAKKPNQSFSPVNFQVEGSYTGPAGKNFPDLVREVMAGQTESVSALQAFNALAGRWKAPPYDGSVGANNDLNPESLASGRALQVSRFSGNIGALQRINSPAILELTLPGIPGRRYLALVGMDADRLMICPAISGRNYITAAELDRIWSGRICLLWKNYRNIPSGLKSGSRGEPVSRLQALLREAGVYRGGLTGVYDQATTAAVENFQSARGLEPDGKAGTQTLILLYRSAAGFFTPELVGKGGPKEG
ncbi:MAG TPA: AAA family ATPase [Geobacteraceae bacterium]|nr:AAA family ATPase [Geobacteraceae bacterium]